MYISIFVFIYIRANLSCISIYWEYDVVTFILLWIKIRRVSNLSLNIRNKNLLARSQQKWLMPWTSISAMLYICSVSTRSGNWTEDYLLLSGERHTASSFRRISLPASLGRGSRLVEVASHLETNNLIHNIYILFKSHAKQFMKHLRTLQQSTFAHQSASIDCLSYLQMCQ